MNTVTFTEPKLCTHGGNLKKSWFVYFTAKNNITGEIKRLQFRSSINTHTTKEARQREGKALVRGLKDSIKEGWSPFDGEIAPDLVRMGFNEALTFGLEKSDVAIKSKSTYRSCIKYIQEAAGRLQLSHVYVKDIKRQHLKLIMEKVREARKLSNTGYNKHLGALSAIMRRLVDWEVIEHNPAHRMTRMKQVETEKFKPYTAEEKRIIQEHLFLNHYHYFVFVMVIYHTGIRPKEVLALKTKDVDLAERKICIYPDLETENSKTTRIRIIPINDHLLPFFREMNLHEYPSEYFVFGSPFPPGQGNRGSISGGRYGSGRPDYCRPSPTPIKRDTLTKLWKRIVIDKLGIEKYQYAAKHTGADDKILAGVDLDALRDLYGHSSKQMTERYAKKIKEIYRQQIIEKSPSFV